MDILTDVLSVIRLRSNLYFRAQLGGKFAIAVPEEHQYIRFHLVGRGRVWIGLPSGESVFFSEGDLVLVPHGSAHTLANEPNSSAPALEDVLAQATHSSVGCMQYGEGAVEHELVCGHFGFERSLVHPILSTLPRLIHISPPNGQAFDWLTPLLATVNAEARDGMPGFEDVLQRLSEVIFIQILRAYMKDNSDSSVALTALVDPNLGPVLNAVHSNPGVDWSLERMAEVAGLSRSLFAERFKHKLSMTPGRYVTEWRMQKAHALLQNHHLTLRDIGKAVGYASDAAFSRIFKEHFGVPPGRHRRSQLQA